jgi:cardiolipin synthase
MTRFVKGNLITLLRNGAEYFPALETAIHQASVEIHLQTYIFAADAMGQRIADALKQAAGRGVSVCVMVDAHGSVDTPHEFFADMQQAGVALLSYRPTRFLSSFKRSNLRRMHRKLAVVDGNIGFVGGINIIDDMNTPGSVPPRVDYAVCVQGPLLRDMTSSAQNLWRRVAWLRWHKKFATGIAKPKDMGTTKAAFVIRNNALHRRDIETAYLGAIRTARHEIIIAHAYFLPGLRFRHALTKAARRGVKVTLLLQERVEFWLLNQATRALYGNFLAAGINIHQYHPSLMHSKVAVIDQHWSTVGSFNLDPISLLLAQEANVIVDDEEFAMQLRKDLSHAITVNAHRVELSAWEKKNLLQRAMIWVGYGLVRLIMGLTGTIDH